jgi:hypothetical protein
VVISKIIYYQGILKLIGALQNGEVLLSGEYFNFGYPIISPCTLRGNGLVLLNRRFYEDNCENIEYGSVVDIGGVKFGHIDNNLLKNNLEKLKIDPSRFLQIAEHCFDRGVQKVKRLAQSQLLIETYGEFIVFAIVSSDDPHVRIFEKKVSNGAKLKSSHIDRVALPIGYKKIAKHKKITFYNPKYGVEHALKLIAC